MTTRQNGLTRIDSWGIEVNVRGASEKSDREVAAIAQRRLLRLAFDNIRYTEKETAHWLAGGLSGRNDVTKDMLQIAKEIIARK